MRREERGIGAAHGKVVLFGEHAVLYGAPALVLPVPDVTVAARVSPMRFGGIDLCVNGRRLDRRAIGDESDGPWSAPAMAAVAALGHLRVTGGVHVDVRNSIPTGRGLGSSAAVALAIVDAVCDLYGQVLSPADRFDLVQVAETTAHGRSSGIDIHGVANDHPVLVTEGRAAEAGFAVDCDVVVADIGTPGRTHVAIETVTASIAGSTVLKDRMAELVRLAADGVAAVACDDPITVGRLMTESHRCLRDLGVSSVTIDRAVMAARDAGAYGAKLTGGGLGGCVIAAVEPERAGAVVDALRAAGVVRCWQLTRDRWCDRV